MASRSAVWGTVLGGHDLAGPVDEVAIGSRQADVEVHVVLFHGGDDIMLDRRGTRCYGEGMRISERDHTTLAGALELEQQGHGIIPYGGGQAANFRSLERRALLRFEGYGFAIDRSPVLERPVYRLTELGRDVASALGGEGVSWERARIRREMEAYLTSASARAKQDMVYATRVTALSTIDGVRLALDRTCPEEP